MHSYFENVMSYDRNFLRDSYQLLTPAGSAHQEAVSTTAQDAWWFL